MKQVIILDIRELIEDFDTAVDAVEIVCPNFYMLICIIFSTVFEETNQYVCVNKIIKLFRDENILVDVSELELLKEIIQGFITVFKLELEHNNVYEHMLNKLSVLKLETETIFLEYNDDLYR